MAAAKKCQGTADSEAFACLLSNGFSRMGEFLTLYRGLTGVEQAYQAHAQRLAARGDARSLLAAATILPFEDPGFWSDEAPLKRRPEASEWLVQAQRSGVDDAVVQWGVATFREHAQQPTAAIEGARAAAARRLLTLQPDNAAVHVLASTVVPELQAPIDAESFKRLAAMPSYRPLGPELAGMMLHAFRGMPVEPAFRDAATLTAGGHPTHTHCAADADIQLPSQISFAHQAANAGSLETLGAVQGPCSEEAVAVDDAMRSECLRFFARLHGNSRTVLERSTAVGIARRVAASDVDKRHWQAAHRRQRWQIHRYAPASLKMDPYARARIEAAAWRAGDEMSGIEAVLVASGIPLEPPPGWNVPGDPSG